MKKSNKLKNNDMYMYEGLQNINKKYSTIILLRHAERFDIPKGSSGSNVKLTDFGEEKAKDLGKLFFMDRISNILSSPLLRCRKTAEKILEGASIKDISIIKDRILGDPGCFVQDSVLCGQNFTEKGTITTVLEYLKGKELPGFRNIKEGAIIMKNFLIDNLPENNNQINIVVSHDAIIMAFISHFIDYNFSKENWLNFLEGVILFRKNQDFYVNFRGIIKKIE